MTAFARTTLLRILLCLLVLASFTATAENADDGLNHDYDEEIIKHLELFHYSEDVAVLGPTRFPRPTDHLGTLVRARRLFPI